MTTPDSQPDVERMLTDAPGAGLPEGAHERISEALRLAETPRSPAVPTHRVALWQAVAAVIVVGAIGFALGRAGAPTGPGPDSGSTDGQRRLAQPGPTVLVQSDIFRRPERRELDVARWSVK